MDLTAELLREGLPERFRPKRQRRGLRTADLPFRTGWMTKVDIADLAGIADDEQFLKQAYQRILGRECDVSGFVTYLELLRRHVPRRAIVAELMKSEEASKRGVRFAGVVLLVFVDVAQFPCLRIAAAGGVD